MLAGDGVAARCNRFWRTLLWGTVAILSDPEPDGDGDGAFRLAVARDVSTVNDNERLQVTFRCFKRINCVVLFAVNLLLQGPKQSRGRKTRSALEFNLIGTSRARGNIMPCIRQSQEGAIFWRLLGWCLDNNMGCH